MRTITLNITIINRMLVVWLLKKMHNINLKKLVTLVDPPLNILPQNLRNSTLVSLDRKWLELLEGTSSEVTILLAI